MQYIGAQQDGNGQVGKSAEGRWKPYINKMKTLNVSVCENIAHLCNLNPCLDVYSSAQRLLPRQFISLMGRWSISQRSENSEITFLPIALNLVLYKSQNITTPTFIVKKKYL